MCFHSKQTKKAQSLENRFEAKINNIDEFKTSEHYHGFTFPKTPVIIDHEPSVIQNYQWGLIPSWAKDQSIQKYTLNARIETIKEKPSFKLSVNKRCLVIIDGFFEWQWLDAKGKSKQKYEIGLASKEAFALAGLYSEWVDIATGEIINSYTIVTTEANKLMSEIHNTKKRMPVILDYDTEMEWLEHKPIEDFKKPIINLVAHKIQ